MDERLRQWEAWLKTGDSTLGEEIAAVVALWGTEAAAAVLRVPVWWLRLWTPQSGPGEDA